MRMMIASDIHGSAYYCQKMLDAFEAEQAERLLLLGDLLYHGPRNDLPRDYQPREVIQQLTPLKNKILAVRGNCDTEVDQMVLPFPIMADYAILYVHDRMIFATHGHHYNQQTPPPLSDGDILLNGHFHVPECTSALLPGGDGHYLYCNPGSVSIPKDNSWHGYMILTDEGMIWKDLDGNVRETYALC